MDFLVLLGSLILTLKPVITSSGAYRLISMSNSLSNVVKENKAPVAAGKAELIFIFLTEVDQNSITCSG